MKVIKKQFFIYNWSALIIIVGVSLFFPLTAYYIKLTDKVPGTKSISIPGEKNGWQLINTNSNLLNSKYIGADKVVHVLYVKEKIIINQYIASYYNQNQEKELIGEQNSIYDSNTWKPINHRKYSVVFSPDCGMQVNEIVVSSKNNQSRLVWYQYNVAGIYTHNKYLAKLLAVWDILFKKQGSQVMILSIELGNDLQNTRDALKRYVTEMQIARNLCGLHAS